SPHLIWPPGGAALQRWGLWDEILACEPALCRTSLADFPGGRLAGPWHAVDGVDYTVNVRRIKLDQILVRAAASAGAEVRERVIVDELLFEGERIVGVAGRDVATGARFRERATIVVGADGKNSRVARTVGAQLYNCVPSLTANYYQYVEDPTSDRDVTEVYTRPPREYLFVPTDEGLTIANLAFARHLLPEFRTNIKANLARAFTV